MGKYTYYVVAIVIAGILWMLEPPRKPKPVPGGSVPIPTATPIQAPTASPTLLPTTPSPTPAVQTSSPTPVPLQEALPPVEALKADVTADPHAPPASGARFALELAKRARAAEASEDKAALFISDLDGCASSRDPKKMNPGTQALCAQVARNLEKKFPVLKTKVEALIRNAEPTAAALANQIR